MKGVREEYIDCRIMYIVSVKEMLVKSDSISKLTIIPGSLRELINLIKSYEFLTVY